MESNPITKEGAAYGALRKKASLRIGLITTLQTNIGDDFIREGILSVLRHAFKDQELEFVPVNKHEPKTLYAAWHPVQWERFANSLPRGRTRVRNALRSIGPRLGMTKFDSCDLIVQCGAPVIWPTCGTTTEWRHSIWENVIGRLHQRIPVMNLAAGSCYAWERQSVGTENQVDRDYLAMIYDFCRLTTVRDPLSHEVLGSIGREARVIPCSASLAAQLEPSTLDSSAPIVINYMKGGGHYDWDQHIDAGQWERTIKDLIGRLSKRHRVEMLCHDEKERDLAREIAPGLHCELPGSVEEYFKYVRTAKAGVCNRMHASVGMTGLGVPSAAICTDTRLLMVQQFGLPCYYVKDATADALEADVENMISSGHDERDRLLALKRETLKSYIHAVQTT